MYFGVFKIQILGKSFESFNCYREYYLLKLLFAPVKKEKNIVISVASFVIATTM